MRWFWSLHRIFGKPADMRTDGHAATLDGAKAQFESIWRRWHRPRAPAVRREAEEDWSRLRLRNRSPSEAGRGTANPAYESKRGWRRLLAEHFVARLLCRLATIVFQHEQPERR